MSSMSTVIYLTNTMQYIDKVRGPLNEGGLYAERQGA